MQCIDDDRLEQWPAFFTARWCVASCAAIRRACPASTISGPTTSAVACWACRFAGRAEFDDGITLVILAVFSNLVLQQIANTLVVRQIVTHEVDGFERVWTHFGYADDDAALQAMRLK